MFGETTISYVKIGNQPIETTMYKWLFGVPGSIVLPSGAGIQPSTVERERLTFRRLRISPNVEFGRVMES